MIGRTFSYDRVLAAPRETGARHDPRRGRREAEGAPRGSTSRPALGALGLALAVRIAAAQPLPSLEAHPAGSEVRVDGLLDEPAWHDAAVIPDLVQQSPVPGAPTRFRTE